MGTFFEEYRAFKDAQPTSDAADVVPSVQLAITSPASNSTSGAG